MIRGLLASLLLCGGALAQTPGADLDAKNAAQDDAIAALIIKNTAQDGTLDALTAEGATRADIDRVIGLEIIDLKNRLDALEAVPAPPDPTPDPDPIPDPPPPDPDPTPDPVPPPPPSSSHSPQTLLGVSHLAYWSHEDAFINHVLMTGRDYNSWVKSGYLDEASATFKAVPATGKLPIGLVRDGVSQNAAHYAGRWVLDWQGDCDLGFESGSVGTLTRTGNRIDEDYNPSAHGNRPPQIAITRLGPAGCKNIRFYRQRDEALLNAGAIFDPAWLADASRFDIIRPMDWTGVNGVFELAATDRPHANRVTYFSGRAPDEILIRAALDSGNALWLNAPFMLGAPQPVMDALRNNAMSQPARVAAVAAAFDQIMASGEILAYARQFVAELNRLNYPLTRPLYIEPHNEIWNFNFRPPTEYAWGIGEALNQRKGLKANMRTGYGWQAARMAEAFDRAFREGGRAGQAWTLVVGSHTANPSRTADALDAVKAYGGPVPMSRYGVATTNYYSGGFRWTKDNTLFGGVLSQTAWESRWLSDLAANRAGLKARIIAYLADPSPKPQNAAWVIARTREHKQAAEARGARYIGKYEGDSHDVMMPALAKNAAAVALFHEIYESPEHGQIILKLAADLKAIDPSIIIANYAFCAEGRQPDKPWFECSPWDKTGGDNDAWRQLTQ